jgi:hypothetical protein
MPTSASSRRICLRFAAANPRLMLGVGPKETMRYVLLSLCIFLAACPGPGVRSQAGYPAEITGVGESANFPTSATGYMRGKMFMYEPGMKNHSVAYDIFEPQLQNAAMLYFYEAPLGLAELFQAEKQQIIASHPGATLLRESSTTLQKGGVSYQAYVATFSFYGVFADQQQQLFSQLILVAQPKRFFKLRSTAPLAQAQAVEAKNKQLLEAVNWAY